MSHNVIPSKYVPQVYSIEKQSVNRLHSFIKRDVERYGIIAGHLDIDRDVSKLSKTEIKKIYDPFVEAVGDTDVSDLMVVDFGASQIVPVLQNFEDNGIVEAFEYSEKPIRIKFVTVFSDTVSLEAGLQEQQIAFNIFGENADYVLVCNDKDLKYETLKEKHPVETGLQGYSEKVMKAIETNRKALNFQYFELPGFPESNLRTYVDKRKLTIGSVFKILQGVRNCLKAKVSLADLKAVTVFVGDEVTAREIVDLFREMVGDSKPVMYPVLINRLISEAVAWINEVDGVMEQIVPETSDDVKNVIFVSNSKGGTGKTELAIQMLEKRLDRLEKDYISE